MQQSLTVIEIRPFKGGWQCYEGPGVGPYWIGDDAKQSAIVGPSRVRARVERFSFRTPSRNGNGRVDMALSASSVGQKLRNKGASKCQNISFRDPIRAKV